MAERKRKHTCDESYVIIIEYGGSFNCTANMWLVPVSVIEKLPHDVMSILKETNTFHGEDIFQDKQLSEKFDYISLLLGLETLESIECMHEESDFFSQLKDLKALHNLFGVYKVGCRENPLFTFCKSERPAHIFLRNNICL